jgi:hypothetical protein
MRGQLSFREIIHEVKINVLKNEGYMYRLRYLGQDSWQLKVYPNDGESAKIQINVDNFDNPDDRGARGYVYRYGDVPHDHIAIIMDSIMERI